MTERAQYMVVVDGGGTGCRARLCTLSGCQVAQGQGGPANIKTNSVNALNNINNVIDNLYVASNLDPARRKYDIAWLGLAGAGDPALAKQIETNLGFARVKVGTDIQTASVGALGNQDGTVAMLGTGSFFLHRHKDVTRRIGGWGFELGDVGGGAWLGQQAMRRTMDAYDGVVNPSTLTTYILKHFNNNPIDIVDFVQTATPANYAEFAPQIIKAQKSGDVIAMDIFTKATNEIGHILDLLNPTHSTPLYMTGGLGQFYAELLPDHHKARYQAPQGDALDGAVCLALAQLS